MNIIYLIYFFVVIVDCYAVETGVVHHLTSPYVKKNIGCQTPDFTQMKRLGFKWVREGVYWAEFEKQKNVFDFGNKNKSNGVATILKRYDYQGFKVLGLFAYSNPIYAKSKFDFSGARHPKNQNKNGCQTPMFDTRTKVINSQNKQVPDTHAQNPELKKQYLRNRCQTPNLPFLNAFATAFEEAVKANPKITHWELLNEMNYKKYFVGGDKPWEVYENLLKVVYPIAKKYNKQLVTGGIALEGQWEKWLYHLSSIECSKYYDILAVHPYCWPKSLEQADFGGKSFRQMVKWVRWRWRKNKVPFKPIWITEIGWPHRRSIRKQEKKWGWITTLEFQQRKRMVIELCKELDIQKVFFYALEDDAWYEKGKNKLLFGFQDKSGKLK